MVAPARPARGSRAFASRPPRGIGLVELAHGAFHVVALFEQCLWVPLAAFRRKEVAAIDVNGASQPGDGIGHRMNDAVAERLGILLAQRLGTLSLELAAAGPRNAAPEDVVLAARIDADHRPHAVVMGHDGHLWCPDHVEDGQLGRVIEPLHLGALGLPKASEHAARIRHGPRYHLAHELVRRLGVARRPAIDDELLKIKRHAALPCRACRVSKPRKPITKAPAVPTVLVGPPRLPHRSRLTLTQPLPLPREERPCDIPKQPTPQS